MNSFAGFHAPKTDRKPKRIYESNSKEAADLAEAIIELAKEYAPDLDDTKIRPQLFCPPVEAIEVAYHFVSEEAGEEEGKKFLDNAMTLFAKNIEDFDAKA